MHHHRARLDAPDELRIGAVELVDAPHVHVGRDGHPLLGLAQKPRVEVLYVLGDLVEQGLLVGQPHVLEGVQLAARHPSVGRSRGPPTCRYPPSRNRARPRGGPSSGSRPPRSRPNLCWRAGARCLCPRPPQPVRARAPSTSARIAARQFAARLRRRSLPEFCMFIVEPPAACRHHSSGISLRVLVACGLSSVASFTGVRGR